MNLVTMAAQYEVWKEHPLYKTFFASNSGKIKRISVNKGVTILKEQINEKGYLKFTSSIKCRKISYRSHRFIYECFSNKLLGTKELNHKDKNKKNNKVENLEIVTRKENIQHSKFGKRRGSSFDKRSKRWKSSIMISSNMHIHIGSYLSEKLAQDAYYKVFKEWNGVCPW